jgi:hypothetical protein
MTGNRLNGFQYKLSVTGAALKHGVNENVLRKLNQYLLFASADVSVRATYNRIVS